MAAAARPGFWLARLGWPDRPSELMSSEGNACEATALSRPEHAVLNPHQWQQRGAGRDQAPSVQTRRAHETRRYSRKEDRRTMAGARARTFAGPRVAGRQTASDMPLCPRATAHATTGKVGCRAARPCSAPALHPALHCTARSAPLCLFRFRLFFPWSRDEREGARPQGAEHACGSRQASTGRGRLGAWPTTLPKGVAVAEEKGQGNACTHAVVARRTEHLLLALADLRARSCMDFCP